MIKKQLKLVILGDSAVGKTSLMQRFVNNSFSVVHKATTGADFHCKDIRVRLNEQTDVLAKLQIWDTAGQEKWSPTMGSSYYRGADCCVLVYDATIHYTLDSIKQWLGDFV